MRELLERLKYEQCEISEYLQELPREEADIYIWQLLELSRDYLDTKNRCELANIIDSVQCLMS